MPPSLSKLPPEIYTTVLANVPKEVRQGTILSLTRAIPRSPVPRYLLFYSVRLRSAESVVQLYRRLRGRPEEQHWVKEFSLETWTVDADVAVNLVALLSQISRITLFVGPNFAPEHLEEMLEKPRNSLCFMSLRFKPYVQRATYYQFLKGAYYDTALVALSRWPAANLPTLSIVQDVLDPEIARRHRFAQPLVFFKLEPIRELICSSYLHSLTSLRLRIPSRTVASFIYDQPRSAPALRVLDLSTCNLRLADVEALVAKYRQLAHLIIDDCDLGRRDTEENALVQVGRTCALATVKAAKEREKKLNAWLEKQQRSESGSAVVPEQAEGASRRARPGRRGLAAATVTLRDPPTTASPSTRASTSIPKIHIVPSSPTLCSLSMTASTKDMDEHVIQAKFEKGWDEGLGQITATRNRQHQSWRNGVRMMCIVGEQDTEEGFEGLKDVEGEEAFYGQGNSWSVPVLCLAGGVSTAGHAVGCGHAAASSVWPDPI